MVACVVGDGDGSSWGVEVRIKAWYILVTNLDIEMRFRDNIAGRVRLVDRAQ